MEVKQERASQAEKPKMTWCSGFNEAAAACHLGPAEILKLDDGDLIGEYCWMRFGGKIQVATHNQVWTVDEDDVRAALTKAGA